jgi:phospholipase C
MGLAGSMGKHNFVDGTLTDQTSILRFVEDNWHTGQIGDGSFDTLAGTLTNMFDFGHRTDASMILDRPPAPLSS